MLCSEVKAEPRSVDRWRMLTEDISNMLMQELARTNITCTYTQTRIAPKQADERGKKSCCLVDV